MATSTISYFSRRGTATPGKSKGSLGKHQNDKNAQTYQVTPLFFQETMEANQSAAYRMSSMEDGDASLSFDQPSFDQSMNSGRLSARQSDISNTSTFRDTDLDQEDAESLMHGQSLISIVNNPKKHSLVRKMASLVKSKVIGSAVPKFKTLKEAQVEDSPAIPKVNPQKDFKDYLRNVSQPCVKTYQENHPQKSQEDEQVQDQQKNGKIKEVDPSTIKKERDDSPFGKSAEVIAKQKRDGSKNRKVNKVAERQSVLAELANNLKRSSKSNDKGKVQDTEMIAEEYFREHYRLPGGFFTIKNPEEAMLKNQDLTKQLEIVEANLGQELAQNFDKFTIAFDNFDEIKEHLAEIQQQARLTKDCIADLKEEQMIQQLKIYALQRRKVIATRARQKIEKLHVLKQSMSVLNQLIEAGNLEIALDLIQNASNLIEKELKNVQVCEGFKESLADFKFRCTQKLDSECVHIVVQWVNSKIQFMSSQDRPDDFKQKFKDRFCQQFQDQAGKLVDYDAMMQHMTFNFDDEDRDRVFFQRLRHFVALLLRTKEMDQFLRSLKTQFSNTAQSIYELLLDVLFENSQNASSSAASTFQSAGETSSSAPSKKDVFKHLSSIEECRNALVIQMVIYGQLLNCARQLTVTVKETAKEWQKNQVDAQCGPLTDEQERGLLERKYDSELKRFNEELREFESRLRKTFSSKLEKNLKRVQDSKVIQTVGQFCDFQRLMSLMAKGLRTHFQMDTSDFMSILEDQQRKYLGDFHTKKKFQLTTIVNEETWVQAKVAAKDQDLTNRINSLDSNNQDDEETKVSGNVDGVGAAVVAETSDYLISTGSGDEAVQAGRKYKVVQSALDFQRIVQEYITLARSFENLAGDTGIRLMELFQVFNSLVCDEILGGSAFQKKKLKNITSKHLALASNCISFVIDEVPFITSQLGVQIKQQEQMTDLERDSKRVSQDLQAHVVGIQDQLMKILQNTWSNLIKSNGISQAQFDAKIEKGQTVQVNQYMLDILNNLTKMHKVLSTTMETGQLEHIFKEAFRVLVLEIEGYFSGINTDSKFAKTRARLDLTQIQRVISTLQFERADVGEMAEQKIKSLVNTKCGVQASQAQPGGGASATPEEGQAEEEKKD